jgi:DNA end-binding protein Ku
MARAIWTGSLSFGLVNVPVGLYSATEDKSIHFNQFEEGTADRVRNKRVNERTGEEVPYEKVVKGYDLGGGEFVIVSPDELAAVAPGPSKTIDVSDFVDLGEIDPIYFERPYYLAPQGKGADRAYALLLEAMTTMNKVAIAQFVMRDKQYLVAIRPHDQALVLETLRFADEVRDPAQEIDVIPVNANFEDRELEMARLLIDSMTNDWNPELYRDTYREKVEDLVEQKRSGAVTVVEAPEAPPAPVVDLLAALQASVDAAKGGRGGARSAVASAGSGSRSTGPRKSVSRGTTRTATATKGDAARKGSTRARDGKATREAVGVAADGASKTELLKQAAELGIPGRTKMSRTELQRAVRKAVPEPSKGSRRKAS